MVTMRMDGSSGQTSDATPAQRPSASPLSRSVKTSERIAAALVEEVIRKGLGPGDRLPNEAAMVEQFGVGRGSLREALRILEIHGLISLKSGPGGGPTVLAVDPCNVGRTFSLYLSLRRATIQELIETRIFLEPMVARMAAENPDPQARLQLEHALQIEASTPTGDMRYIDAANEFHYVISSMTGNNVLNLVATALKELYTTKVVSGGIARNTTSESIRDEHRLIGQAILDGNADQAERLMREHMQKYLGHMHEREPSFTCSPITWG
ncbi:FadR/GntR family transcriptional regulator [Frankia canadensis]|nr:FadR/GntR family transcriptional regulator [Frankia canadensis]